MKKLLPLFAFLLCTFLVAAQGFKLKAIYVDFGHETDMVDNLNYSYFANRMPADASPALRNATFDDAALHSGICENPSVNIGFTLTHSALKNFEWNNSINIMNNRVDGVTYYDYNQDYSGDYVNFWGSHNEIALESGLNYVVKPTSFLRLYGGVGAQLGMIYNNEICVSGSIDPMTDDLSPSTVRGVTDSAMSQTEYQSFCYEGSNEMTQRFFGNIGLGIVFFKRVEAGVNFKAGIGHRGNFGEASNTSNYFSTNFRVGYRF